ncbi:hypothetical protein AMTRI_Chr05g61480 [Amborella trichopoda]
MTMAQQYPSHRYPMNPSFSPFTKRRSKSFFPSLFGKLHLPRFFSCGSHKKHRCFSSGSGNKNHRNFLSGSGNNFPVYLSSETNFSVEDCTKDSCSSNLSGPIQLSIEESAQDSCSGDHSGQTHFSIEESAKDLCSSHHSGQTHLVQESNYCSGNISGNIHFSVDDSDHDSCNDYYWVSSPDTVFGVMQVQRNEHYEQEATSKLMNLRAMHPEVNGADYFESEQLHSTRKMMDLTTIRPFEPPQVDSVESCNNFFRSCMESSPSPSSKTIPRSLLLFSFIFFLGIIIEVFLVLVLDDSLSFLVLFSFLGIFLGHFFL